MKNYYLLSNCRLRRKDNTLYVENITSGERKPIPVEDVESLYLYGEVDLNTKLLNFLTQKRIPLHVFNYYGFYSGSYYPREYLHSGFLVVHQVSHYIDTAQRMALAQEFVRASGHSLLRNVSYYSRRRGGLETAPEETGGEIGLPLNDPHEPPDEPPDESAEPLTPLPDRTEPAMPADAELEADIDGGLYAASLMDDESTAPDAIPPGLNELRATIESLARQIETSRDVNALRGIEGKMRERYYQSWRHIVSGGWVFERRVRRPPDNEINALISFGNSVLYTACLGEIYRTQLTPTIAYLHEPGTRRHSLALDISEIFKPLIVDRAIFRLLNTKQLLPEHFSKDLGGCYLVDAGKKLFLAALEERFSSTILHRRLGRHVSYRHLIRLECYKLIRHLTGVEPYHAFRAWW